MPAFKPDRAKHVAISDGRVRRINVSEFNQHVAMLTLQLWAGLLALTAIETGRRRAIFSDSISCTLAPCRSPSPSTNPRRSGFVMGLARLSARPDRPRQIVSRARGIAWCSWLHIGAAGRLSRLPDGRAASGKLAADIGARQDHHLGIHRRPGARAPAHRHRRGFDGEGQSTAHHARGAAEGIRVTGAPPGSTRIMSSCKPGTSSGWSARSCSPSPARRSPSASGSSPAGAALRRGRFHGLCQHRGVCLGDLAGLARLRGGAGAALSHFGGVRGTQALIAPRTYCIAGNSR